MPGIKHDITIVQGEGAAFEYVYKDELGVPVNLTGYTGKAQVRKAFDSPAAVLDATSGNGKVTIDALAGKVTIKWPGSETATVLAGPHVWDHFLYPPAGEPLQMLYGTVDVRARVTV